MSEYITHSRAETVALGARMAAVLTPGSLVAVSYTHLTLPTKLEV